MKDLIKNAAIEINKQNEEFGYTESKCEVAAQIWHGYLNPMQRLEMANGVKCSNVAAIRECYARVEALI